MICVIDVIEGPAKGQRIWLKGNQSVEVGRLSSVDFSIPADNHLSRRHLRLDAHDKVFCIHDEGSANGTYLNNERITECKLNSGDLIRAGMSKFTVSILPDGENPHASDGVTFQSAPSLADPNKTIRSPKIESPVGGRTISFSPAHDLEKTARIAPSAIPELLAQDRNRFISKWWLPHFKPVEVLPVYEQTQTIGERGSDFITLAKSFTTSCEMMAIVNRSQLSLAAESLFAQLESTGVVQPLMHPLYMVQCQAETPFWRLIEECLGQDAMICIGVRKSTGMPPISQFANSLGFPSLFGIHVTAPGSTLASNLLKYITCAIFEWNLDGKLGLIIDS